jgi:tetraacyldisaccharide 4'-kinase
MKESEIRDIMAGGGGTRGALLRPWMAMLSYSWGNLTSWRRWNYRKGIYRATKVDAPVISVGNLTTGGTGKTPMVAWVVHQLAAAGASPAIVTRGYKARDGRSDEAEMLTRTCDCAMVVNADRVAGARTAIVAGANIIVLDDGFQHRRIHRDLDIVLIDATNPFGFGHVLPRGLMRERPSALQDADVLVVTRCDQVEEAELEAIFDQLHQYAPHAPICQATHKPTAVLDDEEELHDISELAGKRVLAFCGLGNPESFFTTLRQVGADIVSHIAYDDHTAYDRRTVEKISDYAAQSQADVLVTTEKDGVKLAGLLFDKPLWQLTVRIDLVAGHFELQNRLTDLAAAARRGDHGEPEEADA